MELSKDPLFTLFSTTELERDVALLDRVKEKFKLKSDAKLALMIGANKAVLCELRSQAKAAAAGEAITGKVRQLTVPQRLRAFDKLGYAWARDAFMFAVPEAIRQPLLDRDNDRATENMSADETGAGTSGIPYVG